MSILIFIFLFPVSFSGSHSTSTLETVSSPRTTDPEIEELATFLRDDLVVTYSNVTSKARECNKTPSTKSGSVPKQTCGIVLTTGSMSDANHNVEQTHQSRGDGSQFAIPLRVECRRGKKFKKKKCKQISQRGEMPNAKVEATDFETVDGNTSVKSGGDLTPKKLKNHD